MLSTRAVAAPKASVVLANLVKLWSFTLCREREKRKVRRKAKTKSHEAQKRKEKKEKKKFKNYDQN